MFKYHGYDKKLNVAVNLANNYELLNYVYGEILRSPKYDYSDAPNSYVASKYFEFMRLVDINVKVYFPFYRWSRAMGYFSALEPRKININGYMLNKMTYEQIVSLLYHESAHAWNESDTKYNVHHGDNSPIGKENTMMYSINRYVYEFFNYDYKFKTQKPWYLRILDFFKWW